MRHLFFFIIFIIFNIYTIYSEPILTSDTIGLSLSVSISKINLPATTDTTSFYITSDTNWTININQSWLTLSRDSGSNNEPITLMVSQNYTDSLRSAIITVSDSSRIDTITVIQAMPYLSVSKDSINLPASADTASFYITSNTGWTINKNQPWLTLSRDSGSNNEPITFYISKNPTILKRSAIITISDSVSRKTIRVTQGRIEAWTQLNNDTFPTYNLYSVYFIDSLTGYIAGDHGTILYTSNGGRNWSVDTSGTTQTLTSVFFTDSTTGYAVGLNGTILKTTNGGRNWILYSSKTGKITNDLSSVYFTNDTTGCIVGSGVILYTTNGGIKWNKSLSNTTQSLYSVNLINNDGYAVGDSGIIKTTNRGETWTPPINETADYLQSICFTDSMTGYAVGWFGSILKTMDGGQNWHSQANGIGDSYIFSGIYFTNASTGYIVGEENGIGTILKTVTGGSVWTSILNDALPPFNSVFFTDSTTGYIVGNKGIILKTTQGGGALSITTQPVYNHLILYPNPNDGIFTLEFANLTNQTVQICITDISGKRVFETTSTQELYDYNGQKIQSGIYIVTVQSDVLFNVGKMIIR